MESTPGAGSRFTVVLPRRHGAEVTAADPPRMPTGAAAAGDGPALKADVLLIEDDAGWSELIRSVFEPEGYLVRVASTGEGGIAMAQERRPDVILLDIRLPGIDGWEVLRRLRLGSDPALAAIPVVFESAVDEVGAGLALGAADYLVKPIDRHRLLDSIERLATGRSGDPPRDGPPRFVAVDDDPATLATLHEALGSEGYELDVTNDRTAALVLLHRRGSATLIYGLGATLSTEGARSDGDDDGAVLALMSVAAIATDGISGRLARLLPAVRTARGPTRTAPGQAAGASPS